MNPLEDQSSANTEPKSAAATKTGSIEAFFALAALICCAVALPLFDLLGKQPEFFAVRGSTRLQVVVFSLGIAVALPLLTALVPFLLGKLSSGLGKGLWTILFVVAASAVGFSILARIPELSDSTATWLAIPPLAVALAVLQKRKPRVRSFLAMLSLAMFVTPTIFLLNSTVKRATLASNLDQDSPTVALDPSNFGGELPPIFFLVFDEWSLDSILSSVAGEEGSIRKELPNLERLAQTSVWFENATTVSDVTVDAVPAILTGVFPVEGKQPILADHPDNLFSLLAGSYLVHAFEPVTRVCPVEINQVHVENRSDSALALIRDTAVLWGHLTAPPPIREQLPSIGDQWSGFGQPANQASESASEENSDVRFKRALYQLGDDRRQVSFRRFIDSIRPGSDQPNFYFLHSLFPHRPWVTLPGGSYVADKSFPAGIAKGRVWKDDAFLLGTLHRRYLLQVEYLDSLIGEFLDRLDQLGLFEKSLIVLTADHGVTLRAQHSWRLLSPGADSESDIAAVPMLIKLPNQKRAIRDPKRVTTLDLVPTIAQLFGTELPWKSDGLSMLEARDDGTFAPTSLERTLSALRFAYTSAEPGLLEDSLHQQKLTPWLTPGTGDDRRRPQAFPELIDQAVASPAKATVDDRGTQPIVTTLFAGNESNEERAQSPAVLRYLIGEVELPEGIASDEERDEERIGVAISREGKVTDTVWAYRVKQGPTDRQVYRFSRLLPDSPLVQGFNDLAIHWIEPASGDPMARGESVALIATVLSNKQAELIEGSDPATTSPTTTSPTMTFFEVEGSRVPVHATSRTGLLGFLESARIEANSDDAPELSERVIDPLALETLVPARSEQSLLVSGWAIDKSKQEPVESVFLFLGQELLAVVKPESHRRWVADNHGGEGVLISGFEANIDASRIAEIQLHGITAIAWSGGRAARLPPLYQGIIDSPETGPGLAVADGRLVPLLTTEESDDIAAAVASSKQSLRGGIDRVRRTNRHLVLVGWTAAPGNASKRAAPDQIIVFKDGKYQTHFPPRIDRPDLTATAGITGFRYRLPLADTKALLDGRIQVIALAGSQALELTLTEQARAEAGEGP